MVFGVLQKDFPGLFTDLSQDFMSPVDNLAQHQYLTGVLNYGRLTVFPKSCHLIRDQPWCHLEVCQLWQASLGCTPMKDTWRKLIENASLFNYLSVWQDMAFWTAQDKVRYTYNIASLSASQQSKYAVHILKTSPFLKGITVRAFGVFSTNNVLTKDQKASSSSAMGDWALSSVIRTFLAGTFQKETEASTLISAEVVADAATLVCTLISCISTNWLMWSITDYESSLKWVNKSYINLSQPSSITTFWFEEIREEILEKVKGTWNGSHSKPFQLFQQ